MRISRRRLLGAAAGLLAGTVTGPESESAAQAFALARRGTLPGGVLTLTWRRPIDFVELAFDLYNIRVDRSGRTLVATDPAQPSYVVVRFPTQSIAESTSRDEAAPPTTLVPTVAAEPSRLAFEVTTMLPCPATPAGLLDWNRWSPRVVPLATSRAATCVAAGSLPRAPEDTETSLEIPYRLQLSPTAAGAWAHRATPATGADGWTELWHTRLGVSDGQAPGGVLTEGPEDPIVRAVWARYDQMAAWIQTPPTSGAPEAPDDPPGLAMSAQQRLDIVRLTCDPRLSAADAACGASWTLDREPIEVETLMLTSLGGWLVSSASWATGAGTPNTSLWRHRATLGRDHDVRVATDGYLYPFGHRAVLVEVSERKVLPGAGGRSAYLRQRSFIRIRERVRDFTGPGLPQGGRGLPFVRLQAMLESTPVLDLPDLGGFYVPKLAGQLFQFPWRGTDHGGQDVDFLAHAVFVPGVQSGSALERRSDADPAAWYRNPDNKAQKATVDLKPISVAAAADPAATRLVVRAMDLDGVPHGDVSFPTVAQYTAQIPHISALTGAAAPVEAQLEHFQSYLDNGFDGNPGEVYLSVVDPGSQQVVSLPGQLAGVATPEMLVSGVSRALGPIAGDLGKAALQQFDPSKLFDSGAKLLGDLALSDVLAPFTAGSNPEQAMKITTRDLPDGVETTMDWKPKLQSRSIMQVDDNTALEITARITARIGKPAVHDVRGTLSSVTLTFFGQEPNFITVRVNTLRFTDTSGAKPDVHCDIGDVEFGQALGFVKELATLISFGQGNGVSVVPAGDQVTVALDVAVPSLSVGLLALSNLAVHVGLVLPFNGKPVVFDASFATRENKFALGVGILRGGGFAGVTMSARELQAIEFAFEFGAGVSIDLGVASGCVEVMAGIYFKLSSDTTGQNIELTAYLRVHGSVSVLGLITVTVEFYLALTYNSGTGTLVGEATMTVSIDLFLFSQSVSVTCHRELSRTQTSFDRRAGKAGAPAVGAASVRFGDVFTPDLWAQHCAAFAPA